MTKRLQLAIVALFLLCACGTEAPVAVPTAQAPTVRPTATTAVLPGLGLTRAEAQARFERAPFNAIFTDDPAAENGPVVRGTTAAKVDILLRGPAENLREAQVSAIVGDAGASSADMLRAMIALLEVAAPKIQNPTTWLEPHLAAALKTGGDTAIEGDRTIMLTSVPEAKILMLSVQPGP